MFAPPGMSRSRKTTLLRLSWPTIARPRPYFRGSPAATADLPDAELPRITISRGGARGIVAGTRGTRAGGRVGLASGRRGVAMPGRPAELGAGLRGGEGKQSAARIRESSEMPGAEAMSAWVNQRT